MLPLLPFGTWGAASSFSLGGLIGWGAFVFVWVGAGATAAAILPAFMVALLVGGAVGILIHLANVFKGATTSALNGQAPKANETAKVRSPAKALTGMVAAGYVALSAIAFNSVATSAGPEAYQSGYDAGMAEISSVNGNHESIEVEPAIIIPSPKPTKKPTKAPTSRPAPTRTPEPSYPTLYADQNYKCREGPGKSYSHVADIYQGSTHRITTRGSNGWFEIAIDLSYTRRKSCWIGGGVVYGDLGSVSYYEVPASGTLPIYDLNSFVTNWDQGKVIGYLSCDQVTSVRWDYVVCGGTPYNCYLSRSALFGYNAAVLKTVEVKDVCGFIP